MSASTGGGAGDPFSNSAPSQAHDPFSQVEPVKTGDTNVRKGQFDPFGTTNPSTPADTFGDTAAPVAHRTPVSGPWYYVIPAFVAAMIAAVLAILAFAVGGSATDTMFHNYAICGWVMAGIVGFLLIGMHMRADNRRQAENFYIENPMQYVLMRATIIIGSLAVVGTAFEIALWLSKTVG